jgi:hypothetical protein
MLSDEEEHELMTNPLYDETDPLYNEARACPGYTEELHIRLVSKKVGYVDETGNFSRDAGRNSLGRCAFFGYSFERAEKKDKEMIGEEYSWVEYYEEIHKSVRELSAQELEGREKVYKHLRLEKLSDEDEYELMTDELFDETDPSLIYVSYEEELLIRLASKECTYFNEDTMHFSRSSGIDAWGYSLVWGYWFEQTIEERNDMACMAAAGADGVFYGSKEYIAERYER